METILGLVPSKSNCYRIKKGGRGLYKTPALKDYESNFAIQCRKYRNRHIDKPFKLYLNVWFKRRDQDLDNSFKVILDSLEDCGAITNDKLCYAIEAVKDIDTMNPRIEFRLEEI